MFVFGCVHPVGAMALIKNILVLLILGALCACASQFQPASTAQKTADKESEQQQPKTTFPTIIYRAGG